MMDNKNIKTTPLEAVPMPLFPVMGSLQEAFDFADSKRPISTRNELYSLFMVYHNTLLRIANEQPK